MVSDLASTSRVVQGSAVPAFFYGTAWKEERTLGLVEDALAAGFRAIDTANQRRHYHEAGVGQALKSALGSGALHRAELFLQSKFTHRGGQDHRLPYDERAPLSVQVAQSFDSTLGHLGVDYLDSYLLHGPSTRQGFSPGDWEVWRAMEALQRAGKTRLIGVSNVSLEQLRLLVQSAELKPAFVQNRCYASSGWDRELRAFAAEHGVVYQAFSLLTANARELSDPRVARIAKRCGSTTAQVIFRFALEVGMIPLTGTSDRVHMRQDLACAELELEASERATLEQIGRV